MLTSKDMFLAFIIELWSNPTSILLGILCIGFIIAKTNTLV